MQLQLTGLEKHLAGTLAPCYLVSGDEPLLVQESTDAIRRAAREAGCSERQRISISAKEDWLGWVIARGRCRCLLSAS